MRGGPYQAGLVGGLRRACPLIFDAVTLFPVSESAVIVIFSWNAWVRYRIFRTGRVAFNVPWLVGCEGWFHSAVMMLRTAWGSFGLGAGVVSRSVHALLRAAWAAMCAVV